MEVEEGREAAATGGRGETGEETDGSLEEAAAAGGSGKEDGFENGVVL